MYRLPKPIRCLLGFHVWQVQTDADGDELSACQNCGETRQNPAPSGGIGNDYPGSWGQRT